MSNNKDYLSSLVEKSTPPITGASAEAHISEKEMKAGDFDFKISKPQKRVAVISHIKPELYSKVEKLANKNNCSKSHIVEKILEKFLG
jgi:FixJ family two-component response regulator